MKKIKLPLKTLLKETKRQTNRKRASFFSCSVLDTTEKEINSKLKFECMYL